MNTVQEAFQNANAQLLIDTYLIKYPIELDDCDPRQTVAEVEADLRRQLADYIEHLRTVKVQPRHEQWLFYVYHHLANDVAEPSFALSPLSELQAKGEDAQNYSYIYSDHAEVMGFFIAENELTTHYLTELLVDIMHEAAFFGFDQEELAEARQQLDDLDQGQATLRVTEWDDLRSMPASDDFTQSEQVIINQIHQLESKIAATSRHNAIDEILRMQ